MKRLIFTLTGTHGSGKGEVVKTLIERGFEHFWARAFLYEKMKELGIDPAGRTSLNITANTLRDKHGGQYVAFSLYERARKSTKNAVIESVYTPAEIHKIRQASEMDQSKMFLIGVDADPLIRYNRLKARGSLTDNITFEQFREEELRELHSEDPNHHNLAACLKMADVTLINNGTLEEFQVEIVRTLQSLQNSSH